MAKLTVHVYTLKEGKYQETVYDTPATKDSLAKYMACKLLDKDPNAKVWMELEGVRLSKTQAGLLLEEYESYLSKVTRVFNEILADK